MKKSIGLYIHVPFCKSFCPYCDFYKVRVSEEAIKKYKGFLPKTPLIIKTSDGISYTGIVLDVLEKDKCFMIKEIIPDGKQYIIFFEDIEDMAEDKISGNSFL